MIAIQRAWWASLTLAALTVTLGGCSNSPDEPASRPTPEVTPAPASSPASSSPADSTTTTTAEPARDMEKDKAAPDADQGKPRDETPEIKLDSPKIEPPKGEAATTGKLTDDEIAEIKKLPADEQPLALKQMICPISEEHLGAGGMGAPVKVVLDGKTVFLCCKGCKKDAEADPKATLAKLKK